MPHPRIRKSAKRLTKVQSSQPWTRRLSDGIDDLPLAGLPPRAKLLLPLFATRLRPSTVTRHWKVEDFYSDKSRIVFCSSFRRLMQKAQVYSLESNTSVRNGKLGLGTGSWGRISTFDIPSFEAAESVVDLLTENQGIKSFRSSVTLQLQTARYRPLSDFRRDSLPVPNKILGASAGDRVRRRNSFDPRRDVRQRAIHGDSARHAHSSDCHRIDPDHAR
jgi:hypothetical protein